MDNMNTAKLLKPTLARPELHCICRHKKSDAYISRSRAPTHAALSPIGELHCIGATTLAEYREHMEKDAAFERRFQQVCGGGRDEGAEGGEGGYQGGREGRRSGVFEDGRGSSSVR